MYWLVSKLGFWWANIRISREVNNWHSNWNYPLVNKYSNGISPCSLGNTSSGGLLSIAILTYQSVPLSTSPSNYCFMDNHGSKCRCASVRIHMITWKKKLLRSPSLRKKSLKSQVLLESVPYVGCFETGVHCLKCIPVPLAKVKINFLDVCGKSNKLIDLTGKCGTGCTATVIYIPYQSTASTACSF